MNPLAWRQREAIRNKLEADLDDELGFHLEMSQHELSAGGTSPDEAAAAARERLGDEAAIRRQCLHIATGDQIMIKNMLLAASLLVTLTLSVMCVHFYSVARAAKQEAIMQRLLLEQEIARTQTMSSFLQHLLTASNPPPAQEPSLPLLLHVANRTTTSQSLIEPQLMLRVRSLLERPPIAEPQLEPQVQAATQSTQPGEE